jgi:protein-arginine kinase activator protein McsA
MSEKERCEDCGKLVSYGEIAADHRFRCSGCYEAWRQLHIHGGVPTEDGAVWSEEDQEWY